MVRLHLPEKIETERLLLQRLRYEDADEIFYTYASKPDVTRFVSWKTHERVEDSRAFVRYAIDAWSLGIDYSYAIRLKSSHKLIGGFGVINENGRVQFGYILTDTAWGNGYATEACKKMMSILRSIPEVFRINTFVDCDNIASIKVLKKSGLIEEVKFEKWYRFVNQNNEPKDCIMFKLPA
jgi:[ribosomal protein S5]-alanine N-acetyltransferase